MTQATMALVSGFIQGLTEFLPISSSGHLVLFQQYAGMAEPPLAYDVLLHLATMAATILFFFREIMDACSEWFSGFVKKRFRQTHGWVLGWAVIAGNAATVVVALLLKNGVERLFASSACVGDALFVTAAVLWYGSTLKAGRERISLSRGLLVGFVQGLAVVPGISRSGVTIIAGQRTGLEPEEAFRFSFFMSLPAIGGATVLQLLEFGGLGGFVGQLPQAWIAGFLLSFFSGLVSLWILKKVVLAKKWRWFSVYCAVAGTLAILGSWNGG
ncbi:MAG: undecaprenyl-diphosphate phosphatase [Thermovirgaceae bacterium]